MKAANKRRERAAQRSAVDQWERLSHRFIDVGLVATLFIAPLLMGGRGPTGRLLFVSMVCVMATAWLFCQTCAKRASWQWSGAELVLGAGLLLLALQLIPLPAAVLSMLSPHTAELLPAFSNHTRAVPHLGAWSQLSLAPQETWDSLAVYLAYSMLFLVTLQRLRTTTDIEHMLRLIAIAAVGMAVLGLAQFLFGNGLFLWVYDHPFRTASGVVKGPFQAQQHFAQFLVLAIGPLVWWIHHASYGRTAPKSFHRAGRATPWNEHLVPLLWICLTVTVFAIFLTYSRGAFLATIAALATCLTVAGWKSLLSRQAIVAIAGVGAVLCVGLTIHGFERLSTRLLTLTQSTSAADLLQGRKDLWEAHLSAIPDFWLVGSGAGTHRFIYPTYLDKHFSVAFTHGENGYLQVAVETGIAGTVILGAGILLALWWSIRPLWLSRDRRMIACAAAILPGLLASLVQSMGDFIWYIPASVTPLIILLACGNRVCQLTATEARGSVEQRREVDGRVHSAGVALPFAAWAAATCLVAGISLMAIKGRLPGALASSHWDAFRRAERYVGNDPTASLDDVSMVLGHLRDILRENPDDAEANAHYAVYALRLFDLAQQQSENPLPLSQIRDAALASQFPSRQALDKWLAAAVGENRHLLNEALKRGRKAVRECPLQGEAYVCLADLAFLQGTQAELKLRYVEQALLVRPYRGLVLFAAGKEAALVGDFTRALEFWKVAFHSDPTVHAQLLPMLGTNLGAETFLQHFEPDTDGLHTLSAFYHSQGRRDDARTVDLALLPRVQADAEAAIGAEAALLWGRVAVIHARLDDLQNAFIASERAIDTDSRNIDLRVVYAEHLSTANRYREAVEQLQWCARRKPDDQVIRDLLKQMTAEYLNASASASSPDTGINRR